MELVLDHRMEVVQAVVVALVVQVVMDMDRFRILVATEA
jgi:hypothetical protein